MARPEKERVVDEVAKSLTQATAIYLTDFSGLNVEEMNQLRRSFRESAVQYRVVKNTLARMSVQKAGYPDLLEYLDGPTAFAFSFDDPVVPARIIRDFSQKREKPRIKALVFEEVLLDASRVEVIAKLPPREALIAQLLGTLGAPIGRLTNTLQGLLTKFVRTLDAIRAQKEG